MDGKDTRKRRSVREEEELCSSEFTKLHSGGYFDPTRSQRMSYKEKYHAWPKSHPLISSLAPAFWVTFSKNRWGFLRAFLVERFAEIAHLLIY